MGFEKALDGPLHDVQKAFNDRNFAEAGGYLKTLDFRDIEYLPATCSHTAAAINIIEGGGPGLHEELCNAEGNIDIAKVLALCPSWNQAIAKGIPCIVFKRELEAACPELPAFLSKAGNQSHDVHSKETKMQLMLALNLHFMSLKRRNAGLVPPAEPPTWERVVMETVAMKPSFKDDATEAAQFAAAWSGDDQSSALHEVEAYAKQLKRRSDPEKGQLGFLASAKLSSAPLWPIACLKAELAAPDKWISKKGESTLFCGADIKLMETKLAGKIQEAVAAMKKSEGMVLGGRDRAAGLVRETHGQHGCQTCYVCPRLQS